MKDGVTGPELSDQIGESDSTMEDEVVPNFSPPHRKSTHNCSQTRRLCADLKIVGKAGKGGPQMGPSAGVLMASGMNHLSDLAEKPLCLLPASGTGCAAGFIYWTLGFQNTPHLLQRESGMCTAITSSHTSRPWPLKLPLRGSCHHTGKTVPPSLTSFFQTSHTGI